MKLFESFGIKRLVSSILSVVVEVLKAIPGTAETIIAIEAAAGVFGITGIGGAAAKGTLDTFWIDSENGWMSIGRDVALNSIIEVEVFEK